MQSDKYVTVKISGIITSIAKPTDIPGYTEGVLEVFIPDNLIKKEARNKWISENNKRMTAICKFLNEKNL